MHAFALASTLDNAHPHNGHPRTVAHIVCAALQMAYGGENSQKVLTQYAQLGLDLTANATTNYNNFKQSPVDYTTYYYCSFQVGFD
jgi:hypothetical protein